MSDCDLILSRIREALNVPAQRPHAAASGGLPAGETVSDWLPKVGESFDERAALFAANATELAADFRLVASEEGLISQLTELARAEGWRSVATHADELAERAAAALEPVLKQNAELPAKTGELAAAAESEASNHGNAPAGSALPVVLKTGGENAPPAEALARCDAGITACDALVAQTGSVLVTSRSAGGRALSVLPPHHVVVARREQLIADLPAAFAFIQSRYAPDYPSMVSFITGPSRTGDIERVLVLGAHGPKKLTIFCVG